MNRVLDALSARRSAIVTALVALVATLSPILSDPSGEVTALLILGGVVAAVLAYQTAYSAIGRWEKAAAGAVVVGVGALISALQSDLPVAGVVTTVMLAVAAQFGLVPALPSTRGTAARGLSLAA